MPIAGIVEGGSGVFDHGPPDRLQTMVGLMRAGRGNVGLRAGLAVAAGWLPLAVLSAVHGLVTDDGAFASFAADYGVHARSLIAAPLLILAEAACAPRLSAIAAHFMSSGIVERSDEAEFDKIVRSTLGLLDSFAVELMLLGSAVGIVFLLWFRLPLSDFPRWHGVNATSAAGWWQNFVSAPILLILLLGWAWRIGLWVRFLLLVSRLRLQLVAAHPDHAGGLRFLGISVQAFSVVAFAMSVILAGAAANRVMHDGVSILTFRFAVLAAMLLAVGIFIGPLFIFTGPLIAAWRRGVFEYGALARGVGLHLEKKWLARPPGSDALGVGDFSATTDLYSIAANVYAMNVVPVTLMNIAVLVVAVLLPFIPVVLMSVPFSVIVHKLAGVFL